METSLKVNILYEFMENYSAGKLLLKKIMKEKNDIIKNIKIIIIKKGVKYYLFTRDRTHKFIF